jgi:predicted metal-binding protein
MLIQHLLGLKEKEVQDQELTFEDYFEVGKVKQCKDCNIHPLPKCIHMTEIKELENTLFVWESFCMWGMMLPSQTDRME